MKIENNVGEILVLNTKQDYPLFSQYCYLLESGLRKKALIILASFLQTTTQWKYIDRQMFCNMFFQSSITNNDLTVFLTTPLSEQLIKPTLLAMTVAEPQNYLAFKWLGEYFNELTYLKKANELNPNNPLIVELLVIKIEWELWLSTHHLPEGYLGNYEEDITNINLALLLVDSFENKNEFYNQFINYKQKIELYIKTQK